MKIDFLKGAGLRAIRLDLETHTALHVWFSLHAAVQSADTTRANRIVIAGLLPQIERALVRAGAITQTTANDFVKHLHSKPAEPSLDDQVAALPRGATA